MSGFSEAGGILTLPQRRKRHTGATVGNHPYGWREINNATMQVTPKVIFLFCKDAGKLQCIDYGNRMKARSYAEQTFIVQLACGSEGYLPTEKAEKAGHYSAYITSGNVGHEGGDLLVREQLREINEMFLDDDIYTNR